VRVQHRDMATGIIRVICIVRPRVNPERRGVSLQVKDFDNPIPNGGMLREMSRGCTEGTDATVLP